MILNQIAGRAFHHGRNFSRPFIFPGGGAQGHRALKRAQPGGVSGGGPSPALPRAALVVGSNVIEHGMRRAVSRPLRAALRPLQLKVS
jgi:hypothetical protein